MLQLENDITGEILFPMTKVVILALERLGNLNSTVVFFAIDPVKTNFKIPADILSLIKAAFQTLVQKQLSFRLTESLFGQPFLFEVIKFSGGITIIPPQPIFPLQKEHILFNFTLNFSIYQIQTNFEELTIQLKKGINLSPYENLYITLSNTRGSTVAPPTIVHSSVLLTFGTSSRLKQLAQTITSSHSKNLGLKNTVFGKVKQVSISSIIPHSPPRHHHPLHLLLNLKLTIKIPIIITITIIIIINLLQNLHLQLRALHLHQRQQNTHIYHRESRLVLTSREEDQKETML